MQPEEDSDNALREIVDERICRAADAACITLLIMTSPRMSKQVISVVQLAK